MKFSYTEVSVKEAFMNEHADLAHEDGYSSEQEILADKFDTDITESTPYKLYRAVQCDEEGRLDTSGSSSIFVLHLFAEGRVGVINNAFTTWADDRGESTEAMIGLYYNNPEEWGARN